MTRHASGRTTTVFLAAALNVVMVVAATDAQSRREGQPASDGDWPCFRGPHRDGISADKGLPTEWSATKNILWKTPLPGRGASSPIVFLYCIGAK
jgi:hypothetical protein